MWSTDTPWFDLAVVMTIFAIGNVLFGRFEEHKPRLGRAIKVVLVSSVFVLVRVFFGRAWAYSLLALPLVLAAWVHLVWLPKHGINGWTAEPRDRYLELMRSRRRR